MIWGTYSYSAIADVFDKHVIPVSNHIKYLAVYGTLNDY